MLTAQDLIERINAGDSAAVAELYGRYAPLVWRFVCARLRRDVHASQDVLSETFLAAIESLKNGKKTDNVAGWLTGIARHKVADWFRRRARETESTREPATQDALAGEIVSDVLETLTPDERVVLEWKYLDRCSVREIAGRLGRSEKSVESLLFRARKAFRAHYAAVVDEP